MSNIPLLTLKKVLDGLLQWVTDNQNDTSIPVDEKWLYRNFNDVQLGTYKFLDQLQNMVLRTSKNIRKLETRLMFDMDRANFPTIHIHLPQENVGPQNSIGVNVSDQLYLNDDNSAHHIYGRSFDSSYDLIITSDNDMEVIMIYEFLKYLFVSAKDTLEEHFNTFDFSGKELIPNYEIVPHGVYFRALTVKLDHIIETPSIIKINTITSLNFEGIAEGQVSDISNWFLPSYNELSLIYTNLYLEGVGNFIEDVNYYTSTESGASNAFIINFTNEPNDEIVLKSESCYVRAIRTFTETTERYSIGDIGLSGGLIFYIDDTTYYEAAPSDQSISQVWSNIIDVEIGTTETAIGTGAQNTLDIIDQDGHIDSAAKICNDL